MASQSVALPTNYSSYFRWVPLMTPALKGGTCDVDSKLINNRIYAVALVAFLFLGGIKAAVGALFFGAIVILPLEYWIADRAADQRAVQQYLTFKFPNKEATRRIQHSLRAAELLVHSKGNINKLNAEGKHLIDHTPNFEMFKYLVDRGADLKRVDVHGVPFLRRLIENTDPDFLEYVLKLNKIKAADFTPDEQVDFWMHLGSEKAGHLLKGHGFDVNIRNTKGYTPLLLAVERSSPQLSLSVGLSNVRLISIFLQCGADKSLKVVEKGVEKDAMQLATLPAIQNILTPQN